MKMSISITHKPIGLASDHAGFEVKTRIIELLEENNIKYVDFGTCSSQSVDYPDYAHKLAQAIESGECEYGISACGSGNGINMTLNKHQLLRAALCWNAEIAKLARQHNNANVISLPARFVSVDEALQMINTFFNTDFEGGRHQKRIDKIPL